MRTKRHAGLTLVEIIVVIAIIGLLASLLLPALNAARRQAHKTRARSELSQVVAAWKAYIQEYKKFPETTITAMNAEAVRILTGETKDENFRQIRFIDFEHGLSPEETAFNDPWGNVYRVALDAEGTGKIIVKSGTANQAELYLTVAAWSCGPDGDEGTTDDIDSWD